MKLRKLSLIVDLSLLGAVTLAAGISTAIIYGTSKASYDQYWSENFDEILVSKPLSMSASLIDGKLFYKNNLASPTPQDVAVNVTFLKHDSETETFNAVLDYTKHKYSISYPDDFYINGGEITVTYKKLITSFAVTLLDLEIADIEVKEMPYTVAYKTGTNFISTGLKIEAIYNDGTSRVLNSGEYIVQSSGALEEGTSSIQVDYIDPISGTTYNCEVPITVSDDYKLGSLVGIESTDDLFIQDGKTLANFNGVILGRYSSGNRIELSSSDYEITNGNDIAHFGTKTNLAVQHSSQSSIKSSLPILVTNLLQGEDGLILGGNIVNETEYYYNNGNLYSTGIQVPAAGGFAKAVQNLEEGSLTFTIDSTIEIDSDLTLRCANSYLYKDSETNMFSMKPLKINTIADLIVNGSDYPISNNVVLKGCGPYSDYVPLYNVYHEFTFENVHLIPGTNTIKLKFKPSTEGALTYFNESPSTMNIDYVKFASYGADRPSADDVTSIEVDSSYILKQGTSFADAHVPIIATSRNGTRFLLNSNEVTYDWHGESGTINEGLHLLDVSLNVNPSITTSHTFNVKLYKISVECENGVISGSNKVKSETVSEYVDGEPSSKNVTVIRGMDNSTTNYEGETSLTMTFDSEVSSYYNLLIRCDNAYVSSIEAPFSAPSYDLSSVVDIYLNGTKISFSAVIPSCSHSSDPDCTWNTYFDVEIGDFLLKEGTNSIKIIGKNTSSIKNCWEEIAVPRFDCISLSSYQS